MGLCSMPNVGEAFFPFMLVFNVLLPLAVLKDGVRRVVLQVMMTTSGYREEEEDCGEGDGGGEEEEEEVVNVGVRTLAKVEGGTVDCSCCVCLHGFEEGGDQDEEEVSQVVSCRHFFHRDCLDRWLDLSHRTCPLCRSQL